MSKVEDSSSATINVPSHTDGKFSWSKLMAFMGPGFLVSIAYIDPGNFAVDIEAGHDHKYMLLWYVSSLSYLLFIFV